MGANLKVRTAEALRHTAVAIPQPSCCQSPMWSRLQSIGRPALYSRGTAGLAVAGVSMAGGALIAVHGASPASNNPFDSAPVPQHGWTTAPQPTPQTMGSQPSKQPSWAWPSADSAATRRGGTARAGVATSPYRRTDADQLDANAATDFAAARAEAGARGRDRQRQGQPARLLFVVADSLSIDYFPPLADALAPAGYRVGRKNNRCALGYCRAWDPARGEGLRALVANPGLDGCNGGDSRSVLAYLQHLARSSSLLSPVTRGWSPRKRRPLGTQV